LTNTTEADFRADMQKQDAVMRRMEIIGEAAVHLSDATRQAVPELPFRRMRGMRNIVAHEYANVDLNIVCRWRPSTCQKCMPRLKTFLRPKGDRDAHVLICRLSRLCYLGRLSVPSRLFRLSPCPRGQDYLSAVALREARR